MVWYQFDGSGLAWGCHLEFCRMTSLKINSTKVLVRFKFALNWRGTIGIYTYRPRLGRLSLQYNYHAYMIILRILCIYMTNVVVHVHTCTCTSHWYLFIYICMDMHDMHAHVSLIDIAIWIYISWSRSFKLSVECIHSNACVLWPNMCTCARVYVP